MGKRTRRERRAHQREQALATGDITALREIVEKTPLAAVPALVSALGDTPGDPALAAELDVLALGLARRLHQGGEPERALTVAAAAQRRASAWSMEEALTAFALGRDEIAAAVAAADPIVEAALGPLLQAVSGEVAHASTIAAPKLRALHAAARAVGHVVHGQPEKALAIARRIPVAQRDAGLVKAISSPTDANQKRVFCGRGCSPRARRGPSPRSSARSAPRRSTRRIARARRCITASASSVSSPPWPRGASIAPFSSAPI